MANSLSIVLRSMDVFILKTVQKTNRSVPLSSTFSARDKGATRCKLGGYSSKITPGKICESSSFIRPTRETIMSCSADWLHTAEGKSDTWAHKIV